MLITVSEDRMVVWGRSEMSGGVRRVPIPEIGFCEEKNRLRGDFLRAIRELNAILAEQTRAVIDGDPDFSRFDLLIHMAQEKKDHAKYAWIAHVESHGCEM